MAFFGFEAGLPPTQQLNLPGRQHHRTVRSYTCHQGSATEAADGAGEQNSRSCVFRYGERALLVQQALQATRPLRMGRGHTQVCYPSIWPTSLKRNQ
jgi:hypothetical protein